MIKLILKIWKMIKDRRGFDLGSAAGGAFSGAALGTRFGPVGTVVGGIGGALLGGFSKKKKSEEIYDPYAKQRGEFANYMSSKLGTSTPYSYNNQFNIAQPEVESAAEKNILGYLNNPTSNVKDYSEATKKYSDAAKASMAESYQKEMDKTKDMYNRLGLVSSTPGLTAQGDVAESQRIAQNQFDADLMYQNLDRELQAMGLDVSERQGMLGNALNLGTTQRGSQQYSINKSMEDITRKTNEEYDNASLMNSLLGSISPERTVTTKNNTAGDLMSLLQNPGLGDQLQSILGSFRGGGGNGISSIGNGNTTNSHYKMVNGKLTYV